MLRLCLQLALLLLLSSLHQLLLLLPLPMPPPPLPPLPLPLLLLLVRGTVALAPGVMLCRARALVATGLQTACQPQPQNCTAARCQAQCRPPPNAPAVASTAQNLHLESTTGLPCRPCLGGVRR